MDEELEYFNYLSQLISEELVCDLKKETQAKVAEEKPKKKKEIKQQKKEKEPKAKTVVLQGATQVQEEDNEPEIADDADIGFEYDDDHSDDEKGKDDSSMQFSKLYVPQKVDISMKKGKNKFQKLREAAYQEKLEAQDPEAASWEKAKKLATGEKVGMTTAQIKRSMKLDKQNKTKRYEKRVEKEKKEKIKEEKETKKEEMRKQNHGKFGGNKFDKGGKKFDKGGKKFDKGGKKFDKGGKKFDKGGKDKKSTRPSFKKH